MCCRSVGKQLFNSFLQQLQREMEKLLRQKILAELNDKATAHYRSASLKWRGVWPWRKFVREVKKQRHEADTLREKVIVKKAWTKWNLLSLQREMERDAIAVGHYQKSLLKKGLAAWIKVSKIYFEYPWNYMYIYIYILDYILRFFSNLASYQVLVGVVGGGRARVGTRLRCNVTTMH